jgi:membrane protease YdiL (CAAX protease family)
MESLQVQTSKRKTGFFAAIGKVLWHHISLILIAAGWTTSALRRFSPNDATGWTLGHFFGVALLGTSVTWVLIWLLLKHDGQRISDLGLRKQQLKKSILPGVLFGIGIFAVAHVLMPPLTRRWFSDTDPGPPLNWFRSPVAIPAWIFLGLVAGGLTEEVSRAFVLTRFERAFGRTGLFIALILSSVMFGVGHLYQGHAAAFSLGVSGAVFALVYLRRRSCWEAVFAHATFDMIGIAIMFWFYLGPGR